MGIDTKEVVNGMQTKWNALPFQPGLVGGHCIGVDPYYFTYATDQLNVHSHLITSGRNINDQMGQYVAEETIKELSQAGKAPAHSKVVILGLTFKENCPDIRNTKVIDIVDRLKEYGVNPIIIDPWANEEEVWQTYEIQLHAMEDITDADCIILAVAHDVFRNLKLEQINAWYKAMPQEEKILMDVKSVYTKQDAQKLHLRYWNL